MLCRCSSKPDQQEKAYAPRRPQFFFRTADITGSVTLPEGMEMVMPGDNVSLTCELITPVAMEPGLRFALREGGRTVGAGVVSKVSGRLPGIPVPSRQAVSSSTFISLDSLVVG